MKKKRVLPFAPGSAGPVSAVFPVLLAAALFPFYSIADDMPFWGDGSPVTNRTHLLSVTTVIENFSSRDYFPASMAMERFDSRKPGLVMTVR